MNYLCNSFSIQMLAFNADVSFKKIEASDVMPILTAVTINEETGATSPGQWASAIGHADTAAVLSSILGTTIPMQRINVSLMPADTLVVAQVTGGRLPEGVTELPEGVTMQFWKVTIKATSKRSKL